MRRVHYIVTAVLKIKPVKNRMRDLRRFWYTWTEVMAEKDSNTEGTNIKMVPVGRGPRRQLLTRVMSARERNVSGLSRKREPIIDTVHIH